MKVVRNVLLVSLSVFLLCCFTKVGVKASELTDGENSSVLYQEYEKLSEERKSKFGVVPPKVIKETKVSLLSPKTNKYKIGIETYPATYDLRNVEIGGSTKNFSPDVRDQGSLGLCWAFSLNSMLESYLKTHGVEKEYNFSENHLDLVNQFLGSDLPISEGASYMEGIRTWFAGYGPQTETAFGMPYTDVLTDYIGRLEDPRTIINNKDVEVDVEGVELFDYMIDSTIISNPLLYKDITIEKNVNAIKEYIMNNGAIASSTLVPDGFGNTSQEFIYNNVDLFNNAALRSYLLTHSGHALTIIGWDDNYGDINGDGTGDGAWLVQNSWGSVKPYLYISYYDVFNIVDRYGITSLNNTVQYDYLYKAYYNDADVDDKTQIYDFYVGEDEETVAGVRLNLNTNKDTPNAVLLSDNGERCESSAPNPIINGNVSIEFNDCKVKGRVTLLLSEIDSTFSDDDNYRISYYVDTMLTTFNDTADVKMDIVMLDDFSPTDTFYNKADNSYFIYGAPKNINMDDDISFDFTFNSDENVVFNDELVGEGGINNSVFISMVEQKKLLPKNFTKLNLGFVSDDLIEDSLLSLTVVNPINTEKELLGINNSSANFELFEDIDLTRATSLSTGAYYNGVGFNNINFNGTLNGGNHKIIGLNSSSGLFKSLNGATIKNLALIDFNIDNGKNIELGCGALANNANDTIINSIFVENANLSCGTTAGLISKVTGNTTIRNIHIKDSDIDSGSYAGGLVGKIVLSNEEEANEVIIEDTFLENTAVYTSFPDFDLPASEATGYVSGIVEYIIDPTHDAPVGNINNNIILRAELTKDDEEYPDNSVTGISSKNITDNSAYNIDTIINKTNNKVITNEESILESTYENYDGFLWELPNNSRIRLSAFDLIGRKDINIIVIKSEYVGKILLDYGNKILILPPGIKVTEVLNSMFSLEENNKIRTLNSSGLDNSTEYNSILGTGSSLRIYNNFYSHLFGIVVKGDYNADGEIDIRDFKKLANYVASFNQEYKKSILKTNDYLVAGDYNSDGEIDIRDFKKLANYVASF